MFTTLHYGTKPITAGLPDRRFEVIASKVRQTTLVALLVAGIGTAATPAGAATAMVDLDQASTYAVLSGASVGNTVNAPGMPYTTLRGDLGVKPATEPTGFPPGVVTGTKRVGGTAVSEAHADLIAAYDQVAGRPGGTPLVGDLVGAALSPGLHSTAAAVANTGTVTLDAGGDVDAVFVFKIGGALTMAAGARVTLTNGARASRVFWQVNGAAAVGAGAHFAGTLMALDAIAVGAGTEVNGRALSRTGAISLDSNEFYSAPPAVAIIGGAAATTTDSSPTISGTTDIEAPSQVTVTVAGQTLFATPAGGAWSVTVGLLPNASYPVTATVADGAGNSASADQQLAIDTIPPVITIDGGATHLTADAAPTISGTTDVAPGTIVTVTVASATFDAVVQADGTWNVSPAALPDGDHDVTAVVRDPAGNAQMAAQALAVDTTAPSLSIDGGADALTNDGTPDLAGTAAVAPGTSVEIDLADQTLTAQVGGDGAWTVTAPTLADGRHRVRIAVSDAAGNLARATQMLTVDTVTPQISIAGGEWVTTSDVRPTLIGISDAAPGATVTVVVGGQTMTALIQDDRSWNVTATVLSEGTWPVRASVGDPAGNAGVALQTLTIFVPVVTPTPATPMAPVPTPTVGPTVPAVPGPVGSPGAVGGAGPIGVPGATSPPIGAPVALKASKKTVRTRRGRPVRFQFTVDRPAIVKLTVRRRGKVLATKSRTREAAGRSSLTWNGRVKRKLAPRGIYSVSLHAVSPTGIRTSVSVKVRVV